MTPPNPNPNRNGDNAHNVNNTTAQSSQDHLINNTSTENEQNESQEDDVGDENSISRAAAQVSVLTGNEGRRRPPGVEAANAAIQGTAGEGEMGAEAGNAFEVVDEGGELVRVRFQEFLQNL